MSSCRPLGALNVSSFHENIRAGHLPSVDSITFEGLFAQYYFTTGCSETEELVQATYSIAQVPNAITGEVERYLSIGLNSSEDGKNHREPLNLIIVLDISGSMGSRFRQRRKKSGHEPMAGSSESSASRMTKMDIAKDVLADIVKIMTEKERLGILLFDTRVDILQPLRDVSLIDREQLVEERIPTIQRRGGTNMGIALSSAIEMLSDHIDSDVGGASNHRIVFLTDAQPNAGAGAAGLVEMTHEAAKKNIFTTFIGIGLDFNSDLTEQLTKVRGANYFAVHSKREFASILNEDFNYVVSELAYETSVSFESDRFEVDTVFGTPFHAESGATVVKIGSLAASAVDPRGTKAGIILARLKEVDDDGGEEQEEGSVISMTLRYVLAKGGCVGGGSSPVEVVCQIDFEGRIEEMVEEGKIFEHEGIRKAVLLAQYGTTVRGMLRAAREEGLDWIPEEDIERLKQFKAYYQAEAGVLNDKSLVKELDTLDRLIYQKTS